MLYRYLLSLGILFFTSGSYAQNNHKTGIFYLTNVSHKFNNHWSAYLENQWRSLDGFEKFYYYELKAGATYKLNESYSFTLGTGIYETFAEGEGYENYSRQFENRVWQQVNLKQNLSVIHIEHRYRAEQRFKSSYENRFRYRLKTDIPLNNRKIEPETFFFSVYNELFFTDQVPNFSRNRFQIGGGYEFSDNISLQIGWLRQVDFNESSTRKKSYIYTGLSLGL